MAPLMFQRSIIYRSIVSVNSDGLAYVAAVKRGGEGGISAPEIPPAPEPPPPPSLLTLAT